MAKVRWHPNNRVTFEKWHDCDICGIPWPESALAVQRGLLVCPDDLDDPNQDFFMRDNPLEDVEDYTSVWEREE